MGRKRFLAVVCLAVVQVRFITSLYVFQNVVILSLEQLSHSVFGLAG